MKKQTAAVMSAVTLISSVVPIAPVSAMENQEALEEMVEQTTEHVEGAIASSEILQEGNGIISEEVETVTEEIKEDAVNTELLEEVTSDINVESNEGEKIEVKDEEVFEEEIVENMEELPSNEVTEDVIETENTENEMPESTTEENTEEAIKVEQEIETNIQSGNMTENSQEGEKTQESITDEQEEVEIPDAVLKAVINEALGRYDDLAHPITKSELEEITYLYHNPVDEESNKITSLTGLEYAINLTELFLPNNQISDLSPLASLKKLNDLVLDGNQISDFSPVDHISYVRALNQVIYLETQHINKGGQVIINNPILGKDFNITTVTGVYSEEKNQLIWDNVTTHHLQFTFKSVGNEYIYGIVIVPVEFKDGDIEEEIIKFNDTKLQALINEELGRSEQPTHPITKGEIEQISGLKIYDDVNITNLDGLQYATNMTSLMVYNNQITDLTPLEGLTNLKHLALGGDISDLTSIKGLMNLTNLISLDLSGNSISNLEPLESLKNLTSLNLNSNFLDDLTPLSNLTNLTSLEMSWSSVSDISGLEDMENLTYLDLSYNSITNLAPLTNLTNLKALDLSYNAELSNLAPLSNLTNLTELNLYQKHGKISELASLSNLSNLKYLYLLGNEVSDLTPLSNLTKLEVLSLGGMGAGGNQISDINPLSNLKSLKELYLDCNQISDISPISKLTNLSSLSLVANQVKDLTPLDALQSLEYLSIDLQEITLDPVYIQRGETVVIDNPLVGQWWNMTNEYYGTTIYDNEFNIEKGYYDAEKNQFIFEDVTTDTLSFSFSNYSATDFARQYQGNTDGTVTIPVIFYEISENFIEFVKSGVFEIKGGTGKLNDPLVLQIIEGTEVETIRSELAKYSDYDLSVTKPVTKERTATEVESYVLTFSKGEEKVIFKVQVPVTETEMISYLNSLINQPPAGGTTPPAGGTTPPAGGTTPPAGGTTPPAGGTTPPAGGTTPPAGEETTPPTGGSSDSSENPETGFTGLMGMIGLGTLSLGAVFSKRKKK